MPTIEMLRQALTSNSFSIVAYVREPSGDQRAVTIRPQDILEFIEAQDRRLVKLATLFADKQP